MQLSKMSDQQLADDYRKMYTTQRERRLELERRGYVTYSNGRMCSHSLVAAAISFKKTVTTTTEI